VEVEGVSQVFTNRDEIGSLIMRKGMDSMISRLRRQVGVPAASAS
jgi:ABC-type transporter MlaC component